MPTNYMSFEQRATVVALLNTNGYGTSRDYDTIVNVFNQASLVPNDPAPIIPQNLNWPSIKAGIEQATLSKMDESTAFDRFLGAVKVQDRDTVAEVIGIWQDVGKFTEAEIGLLNSLTSATMPDPNWPPLKFGPSIWQAGFLSVYRGFAPIIDGLVITQCHKALLKEAKGDYSE